jgi:ribose 1,5-bisphosphokinase
MIVSSAPNTPTGVLVLVVGQSGVGKDTLLRGARAYFADDTRVTFAERTITRPSDPNERHRVATRIEFDRVRAEGGFAFWWQAHGLHYGVPISIDAELAAGRMIVCNTSRTVIADVRRRYPATVVIEITAGRSQRLARLNARAREAADEIEHRLDRHVAMSDTDGADIVIENSGAPDIGIRALIEALGPHLGPRAHGVQQTPATP